MNPTQEPEEKPSLPPEELERRRQKLLSTAGWMILGLVISIVLLLIIFLVFGGPIRQFLESLKGF